jgi:membrane-associated phospholipid phosphatase
MLDILNYLNDPSIVANVQRYFGIEAQFQKTNKKSRKKQAMNDDHKINSMFWYYIFHIGATFGTESFYTLFFPIWFWNIDGVIFRKISIIWASFMYVGQATKDIFEIPRPASPPVVKVEKQYAQEYGFPSTHAMIAAGFPLALVYLSQLRYNVNAHRAYW